MKEFANPWGLTPFPVVPFKHLYSAQLGKMLQPNPSEGSVRVKYLNASQVQWEGVDEKQKFMYASSGDLSKYGILPGDLLILEGGEVGRACFVTGLDEATIIQNSLHRVRGDAVDLRWLYYCMRYLTEIGWIGEISKASTISHLTGEKLKTIPIPNPPKLTKQRVAAFLDEHTGRIDTLTAELKQFAETLKMQRKAMISECVTRGTPSRDNFWSPTPDRESSSPWANSVYDVVPVKFKYSTQLGKMLQPRPSEGAVQTHYLNSAQVTWDGIKPNLEKVMYATPDDREKYGVAEGDLLILEGGDVGRCCFAPRLDGPVIIQNSLHRVRGDEVDLAWLKYCLSDLFERGWIREVSRASTIGHFTAEKLRNTPIPWPNAEARLGIVGYLDEQCGKIDELLTEIGHQIDILAAYRKSLISEAVTGKIEV